VRQIYPDETVLADAGLAGLYAYPDRADSHWLRANMVMSLDGAATLRGRSGGLSGEADREIFAMLRALADVIVVGAGTARVEGYGPVQPGTEGTRWAWLREGRPASAPIAVLTRRLDLDLAGTLLAHSPAHARTIVITTEAAPAGRRSAAARTAEVIVAGEEEVDLALAVGALAERGHRRMLTEGGPHLLSQIAGAGLLDELCLTLSPVLTGPGAGRIVQGTAPLRAPGEDSSRPLTLAHVLADEGYLLCRYLRQAG
jgi:riboflavin biosynthesis pyrimidine reductase